MKARLVHRGESVVSAAWHRLVGKLFQLNTNFRPAWPEIKPRLWPEAWLGFELNPQFFHWNARKPGHLDSSIQSRYLVQPEYKSVLLGNLLVEASDVLSLEGGTVVRAVPGRKTRRIELTLPNGSKQTAYLKCYESKLSRRQHWLGSRRCEEKDLESLNEWRQILALRKLGFRTAAPMAAGWKRTGNAIRSFVMTAEIPGAVSGYDFWAASSDPKKREFIPRLADLAKRFHQAGFIHKDFYLDHIFVAEREDDLELTIIDLQRVLGPRTFRKRWLIKDVGSMLFALQKAGAKWPTILRFFKLYHGTRRSSGKERKFLWKALKRAARVHEHKPKFGEPEPRN